MSDLAIITVSFNTVGMLGACLASVYEGLEGSAEVWVVDNASSDGSPEMVRSEFPKARLMALAENVGFAAGNNAAIRAALDGESPPRYLFLLNPDTEIRGEAIRAMVRFMDATPSAGMCGAALVYPDGGFQHAAFRFPTLPQIWFDFFHRPGRLLESPLNGRYPRSLYETGRPFEVDHPLGATMLVRRKVLEEVGALDESYFMYAEEIDWCMRIRRAGWKIYCVPSAVVMHHGGGATRQFRDRMFVALWRSRLRLFRLHYGPAFNLAARWLVRLGLRAEERRARRTCGGEELERRLAAYDEVRKLL